MSKEEILDLIEEIEPDKDGWGYIDCGSASDYSDNGRYRRIVAAIKQNVELQRNNEELTTKLEAAEAQVMESINNTERLKTINERGIKEIEAFMDELCIFLDGFKNINYPLRIADYLFEKYNKHVVYSYDPLQQAEPMEVKILITESTNKNSVCPICNKKIGKYPAISRQDNITEICANCGMLEAIAIFNEANKDKNE